MHRSKVPLFGSVCFGMFGVTIRDLARGAGARIKYRQPYGKLLVVADCKGAGSTDWVALRGVISLVGKLLKLWSEEAWTLVVKSIIRSLWILG